MKGKIAIAIAVVAVAIVVGGLYFLMSSINSLVARAIESEGSKVTSTNVSVSGVDIKIRDARGSIDKLTVASPSGFNTDHAFSLGNIVIDIDPNSLHNGPLVVEEIRISEPVIHVEVNAKGQTNIEELRKRVSDYVGGGSGGGEGEGADAEKKRMRIATFAFEKGRVEVDATALGLEKRTIDLPAIRLTDVGGSRGAPPDQLVKEIVTAVTWRVTNAMAGSEVEKLIKDQLGESLGDKAKGFLDKITK